MHDGSLINVSHCYLTHTLIDEAQDAGLYFAVSRLCEPLNRLKDRNNLAGLPKHLLLWHDSTLMNCQGAILQTNGGGSLPSLGTGHAGEGLTCGAKPHPNRD